MVIEDLTWPDHARYLAYRTFGFLKIDALKSLYISVVGSHLVYCSHVRASKTSMMMMEIEKVQRRASRFNVT